MTNLMYTFPSIATFDVDGKEQGLDSISTRMDLAGLSAVHENSVLIFAARDILGKHGSRHNNLVKEFLPRGPILPHYVQHFEAAEQ